MPSSRSRRSRRSTFGARRLCSSARPATTATGAGSAPPDCGRASVRSTPTTAWPATATAASGSTSTPAAQTSSTPTRTAATRTPRPAGDPKTPGPPRRPPTGWPWWSGTPSRPRWSPGLVAARISMERRRATRRPGTRSQGSPARPTPGARPCSSRARPTPACNRHPPRERRGGWPTWLRPGRWRSAGRA